MALKYGTLVRNAKLDAIESTIGATAKMRILTGSPPTAPGDAETGTLLCEITLPSDWMSAASAGSKAKNGTWSGTASATGTAGYFRIVSNAGTPVGIQGTITATGGGGDATVENTSIATSQPVTVNSFTLTDNNG